MGGDDFRAPMEPPSERLSNADFRKLMMTPRAGTGAVPATPSLGGVTPGGGAMSGGKTPSMTPRRVDKAKAEERRKKKTYYAKLKKDEDDKMAELASKYRDRAKERRSKFGDDDKPPPNRFKEKFMKAMDKSSSSGGTDLASAPKVAGSNIGNKMLQKMGWKDGQGLGKNKQGRTDIILAQQRTQGSGLGTQQSSGNPNDSYKENARKTLWSRYNSQQ